MYLKQRFTGNRFGDQRKIDNFSYKNLKQNTFEIIEAIQDQQIN